MEAVGPDMPISSVALDTDYRAAYRRAFTRWEFADLLVANYERELRARGLAHVVASVRDRV